MSEFDGPDELAAFARESARLLQSAGLHDEAGAMNAWQAQACTTSSEWLAELGKVLQSIDDSVVRDGQVRSHLERLWRAVRDVWPTM